MKVVKLYLSPSTHLATLLQKPSTFGTHEFSLQNKKIPTSLQPLHGESSLFQEEKQETSLPLRIQGVEEARRSVEDSF